ncbi:MAG: 2-dehydropantoate 2-reductase [Clostridiales bacterium]|nr:2-dehydropantoate 2-reductase [Clostridiales bacterium]
MKITVIGAGAMGSLYGAKLSASPKNEVVLLDIWKEHVDAINACGLLLEEGGEPVRYGNLSASTDASLAGHADFAIIFVKSTVTKQAVLGNIGAFGPKTTAITLQNGLGNIDLISEVVGRENVLAGTTAQGAMVLGPGKVRHSGHGRTVIGELDGTKTTRIETVHEMLSEAGFETTISDNVVGLVWDKLLVNAGINALVGITGLFNGELLGYPELLEILELAVLEGKKVAESEGVKLGFPDPVSHALEVCAATAETKASMLQDVLNHRKTEIDMINGAIVRIGGRNGVETPVNRSLTNLIKFIEKHGMNFIEKHGEQIWKNE